MGLSSHVYITLDPGSLDTTPEPAYAFPPQQRGASAVSEQRSAPPLAGAGPTGRLRVFRAQ
ncbi:hypothetical protein GCM10027448_11120 [Nocardioides dilutus]